MKKVRDREITEEFNKHGFGSYLFEALEFIYEEITNKYASLGELQKIQVVVEDNKVFLDVFYI